MHIERVVQADTIGFLEGVELGIGKQLLPDRAIDRIVDRAVEQRHHAEDHGAGGIGGERGIGNQRTRGGPDQRRGVDQVPAADRRQILADPELQEVRPRVVDMQPFEADVGLVGGAVTGRKDQGILQLHLGEEAPARAVVPVQQQADAVQRGAPALGVVVLVDETDFAVAADARTGARHGITARQAIVGILGQLGLRRRNRHFVRSGISLRERLNVRADQTSCQQRRPQLPPP